jgi:LAO/AO transport system kinase
VPVLKTTATSGEGIEALGQAIEEAGARAAADPPQERRRRRARYLIARAAADAIAERIKANTGGDLDALADAVLSGRLLPADAAKKLIA